MKVAFLFFLATWLCIKTGGIMIAKNFRVISNSCEYLTQEAISQALLEQITLPNKQKGVFFAVVESNDSFANTAQEHTPATKID